MHWLSLYPAMGGWIWIWIPFWLKIFFLIFCNGFALYLHQLITMHNMHFATLKPLSKMTFLVPKNPFWLKNCFYQLAFLSKLATLQLALKFALDYIWHVCLFLPAHSPPPPLVSPSNVVIVMYSLNTTQQKFINNTLLWGGGEVVYYWTKKIWLFVMLIRVCALKNL